MTTEPITITSAKQYLEVLSTMTPNAPMTTPIQYVLKYGQQYGPRVFPKNLHKAKPKTLHKIMLKTGCYGALASWWAWEDVLPILEAK